MSEKASARPSQVTMAAWTAVIGSVLLVLTLFDAMSNLRTVEFRDSIDEFLSTPPGNGLGLEIGQVVEIMRVLMLFSGAAAAAAMVLAIYVLQRNRAARVGYTIAAVAIVLTAPAVGGFLPVLIAFAAIMLWTRPARDWFAGRPVTAGSGGLFGSRTSGTRDGASLSSSNRPDAPRHLGGDAPSGDSSEPGSSAGSAGGAQAWPRMPEGSSDRPTPPPTEGFGAPGAQGRPDHPGQPGPHQGGPSYPQGGYPPPYGQPGQQGSWPPPQYGQPPYGGPGYGQHYPQQYGQRRPGDGDKRPASVTTAAWITWALSVLTLLGFVIIAVVVVAARGQFLDLLRQDQTFQQMNVPAEQVIAALWVMGAIAVFWSIAAMVLAWFAYRRANWARITLVVSAVISGLLSLAAFPVGLLNTVGSLAVVVLLFVGGANDWYARRSGGQGFPGPFQPYGQPERQVGPDDQRGQPPYGAPSQEPRAPQDREPSQPPSQPSAQPPQPPSEPSRGRGKDEPPSNVW